MSVKRTAFARMSHMNWVRWVVANFLVPIDNLLPHGRSVLPFFVANVDTLMLTTTGRRSGEPRSVQLTYVNTAEGRPAVVGTNFAKPNHPAWVLNLEANPSAIIGVGDSVSEVEARIASQDEARWIWECFTELWSGYGSYREAAERDIKVFVLDAAPR